MFRRHDRVRLAREFDPRAAICNQSMAGAARDWIARGRALVVARQEGVAPDSLRLGITFPGAGARRRVSLVVPRQAVVAHEPPILLSDAMTLAPLAWKPRMVDLSAVCAHHGMRARVYGSLACQVESGEDYLNPDSDLDVLFLPQERSDVRGLLASLRALDDGVPRIDGEVLTPEGWAIAWRELAAARLDGAAARVLAKSEGAVAMLALDALFADAAMQCVTLKV